MSNFSNRGGGGGRGGFKGRRSPMGNDTIVKFRFLIPSKAASIIIGPRGERIQRLMRECNSRLSIPDNKGPERLLLIDGTLDNCIKFWSDCFPDLKDVMSAPSRKGGTEMDLRFLCHNSVVGAIIGKGGSKVKDMRTTYQLSLLKVHTDLAPLSTDRILQIIGPPEKVFECLKILFTDLEEQVIRGHIDHYNPQNYDSKTSLSYGGWPPEGGWQFEGGDYNQSRAGRYDGGRNAPHSDQYDGLRNGPQIDPRNMALADDPYDEPRNLSAPYSSRGGHHMEPFGERNFDHYTGSRSEPQMNQFKRPRNTPHFDQYGGPRDEVQLDQFGGPRDEVQLDQFGGPRNQQMDQYDGQRVTPLMDQFIPPRNLGHQQIDQYDGSRNELNLDDYRVPRNMPQNHFGGTRNPESLMDPYDTQRSSESLIDHYGGVRNPDPSMDNYCGSRNNEPPFNNFGGPRNNQSSVDHFGSERNTRHPVDPYVDGRNAGPILDSSNEEWDEMAPFSGGLAAQSSNQFSGRGGMPPPNQFCGNSRGGAPNNQLSSRSRMMAQPQEDLESGYGYENGGKEFFKSKNSFEDRRQAGGLRRSFPDDRQSIFNKKPRTAGPEDKASTNNIATKYNTNSGEVDVTIPSEYISVLQGVGGEKLYNIMKDSGAIIVIKPEDNASDVRVLTLKGTKDEIEGAQYLMQMCIKRVILNM